MPRGTDSNHLAAEHDKTDVLEHPKVLQRIAGHGDDVGELAHLEMLRRALAVPL
jgi:hypothetical protein